MTAGRKILKDIGFYSSSILLTQGITVAASILTRRFLGPAQMGVWAFLQTLLGYADYSALGTTTAVSLEIPLHHGRGDTQKAKRVLDAAFSFAVSAAFALALAVTVYAFWKRATLRQELFYGLLMAGGFVILQRLNGLAITVVRANKQFVLAGKQMLYSAAVNAALIALLSYRFKIYGFLAAMALSLLFNILYLVRRAKLKVNFVSDWRQMGELIRFGLPLMAVGLMTTFFETLDRLLIARFLGFEALGFYSVALMTINYLNGVPNSVGIVTTPHLQEKHGAQANRSDLLRYLVKVDAGYGMLMAVLIGGAWFLMPEVVRLAMPEFGGGLPAMRWLVLGAYFTALTQGYGQLLYVTRRQNEFLVLIPAACLVALVGNGIALRLGYGVEGVACVMAVSYFFYFSLLFFHISLKLEPLRDALKRYVRTVGLFGLLAGVLVSMDRWVSVRALLDPWIKTVLYLLVIVPVLFRMSREFGLKLPWQKSGGPAAGGQGFER